MFVLLPHGGATLAGKRSSWYPGLHRPGLEGGLWTPSSRGPATLCGELAGGARTPGWVERPPRGAQGGPDPPVWWDGPGQMGQERSVPEVRWPRSPPGQFLVWSEMLSREPCRGDPLPQAGGRGVGWCRGMTFQSQAGAAGQEAVGRLGRAFAEGAPSLGWALTSAHPFAPCFPFLFGPSPALTFTLGVPLGGTQTPPHLPPPMFLSCPLCSADRPGDPRVRGPGTPGPPHPADSAATQHRHQTTGVCCPRVAGQHGAGHELPPRPGTWPAVRGASGPSDTPGCHQGWSAGPWPSTHPLTHRLFVACWWTRAHA